MMPLSMPRDASLGVPPHVSVVQPLLSLRVKLKPSLLRLGTPMVCNVSTRNSCQLYNTDKTEAMADAHITYCLDSDVSCSSNRHIPIRLRVTVESGVHSRRRPYAHVIESGRFTVVQVRTGSEKYKALFQLHSMTGEFGAVLYDASFGHSLNKRRVPQRNRDIESPVLAVAIHTQRTTRVVTT